MPRTKIICTIGPASDSAATLRDMMRAGMNVARLNFSHGTQHEHRNRIDTMKKISGGPRGDLELLQDLEGFRIRVATLPASSDRQIRLTKGQTVYLTAENARSSFLSIPIDYEGSLEIVEENRMIFIDDGTIALKVLNTSNDYIACEVVVPGIVKQNKGINIPDVQLPHVGLKPKDRSDIRFGLAAGVDFIAQSFVRNGQDMKDIRKVMSESNSSCRLVAKIENRAAIRNLDEILDIADGIMVARGDLGVSLPIYQLPVLQKILFDECRRRKKFVITATQMMESMTHNPRPTRAEVSDVANAVLDGSDYVMLSGETAVGRYPVDVVKMMGRVVEFSEQAPTLDYFTR